MPKIRKGGYVPCACRDCFEIAISDKGEAALCHECIDAGCEACGERECQREDAYGSEEDPHALGRYVVHLRTSPEG
jgi:hypothetical protein